MPKILKCKTCGKFRTKNLQKMLEHYRKKHPKTFSKASKVADELERASGLKHSSETSSISTEHSHKYLVTLEKVSTHETHTVEVIAQDITKAGDELVIEKYHPEYIILQVKRSD